MNLEGTGAQLLPRFTSSSAQNDFIGKCQLGLNRPVVVGLIGKSWQGKGVLGNILTDRAVFEVRKTSLTEFFLAHRAAFMMYSVLFVCIVVDTRLELNSGVIRTDFLK
jgi:hypothetical protein